MQDLTIHQTPEGHDCIISDLQQMQKMCTYLMQTPHYKKMGAEGVFAIVQKAKSLNISPLDALNGGLYFVSGKVEMSSQMMSQLIRQCGHSVTKDEKSSDTICILHGRRRDTGDTWTEYFSIDDAKRAGIYKEGGPWGKYPRNMLYARALSNLARQLFPDVIKGCYVEGEIRDAGPIYDSHKQSISAAMDIPTITHDQYMKLEEAIGDNDEYRAQILSFIKIHRGIDSLKNFPSDLYEKAVKRAIDLSVDKKKSDFECVLQECNDISTNLEQEYLQASGG